MQKNLTTKAVVIVATILLCIYGIIGIPKNGAELQANISKNILLGLDLKGGSQLELQVQVQDAIKGVAQQVVDSLQEERRKGNVDFTTVDRNDPNTIAAANSIQINIHGVNPSKTGPFRSYVTDHYNQWNLEPVNATDYKMTMKPSDLIEIKRNAVAQSIDTITNWVNALGLTEPVVRQEGRAESEFEILVQLPGVDDPARVKDIIGQAAQLSIVEVKEGPFQSEQAALQAKGGILPLNTELLNYPRGAEQGAGGTWYLVSRSPVVTGQDLRNARPSRDEVGKWEASFTLSPEGGKKFEAFTSANIGNKLGVVLDKTLRSVATINSAISDSGRITGLGSEQEASDLALVMRSGSLPAGIQYLSERTVGPSLGADSIHQGFMAGIAGLLAVVLVMLVYYKKSGINAVLALALNTVILVAALSYFHAVLTLPGIAGIILTIGMAVDSNVLIFERIREELHSGKAVVSAVEAGFGKAWWTIVDTHVTTVVSCLFLFLFGTGPVKGFAVTLVIGLLANVFTAVFVSKTIFEYELSRKRQVTALSI
jgi:preprotein translocase subunit SecD